MRKLFFSGLVVLVLAVALWLIFLGWSIKAAFSIALFSVVLTVVGIFIAGDYLIQRKVKTAEEEVLE